MAHAKPPDPRKDDAIEPMRRDATTLFVADLGNRFTAPFVTEVDGKRIQFLALVHLFGRPIGTVISVMDQPSDGHGHPQTDKYFRSILNGECYRTYDRELFIETLDDWHYFGFGHKVI
jgi:hypothetical protein